MLNTLAVTKICPVTTYAGQIGLPEVNTPDHLTPLRFTVKASLLMFHTLIE